MPDQTGRTVVVTGATSGLGEVTANALAAHGALVVLAARDPDKTAATVGRITQRTPQARLGSIRLDLADLSSVAQAAEELLERHDRIDVLVNNAGVMATPERRTADGFELQLGTNHLGHFAFTGRVLPAMRDVPGSRIVTVSSTAHRMGSMDFDDLNFDDGYSKWGAYGRSKLANLLFTFELQRRLEADGAETIAVAAHPGYAATNLQTAGPKMIGGLQRIVLTAANTVMNALLAQPARRGALPQLYAATAPGVTGGTYWGPSGIAEARGHPGPAAVARKAQRIGDARRLWAESERLTGVTYA